MINVVLNQSLLLLPLLKDLEGMEVHYLVSPYTQQSLLQCVYQIQMTQSVARSSLIAFRVHQTPNASLSHRRQVNNFCLKVVNAYLEQMTLVASKQAPQQKHRLKPRSVPDVDLGQNTLNVQRNVILTLLIQGATQKFHLENSVV